MARLCVPGIPKTSSTPCASRLRTTRAPAVSRWAADRASLRGSVAVIPSKGSVTDPIEAIARRGPLQPRSAPAVGAREDLAVALRAGEDVRAHQPLGRVAVAVGDRVDDRAMLGHARIELLADVVARAQLHVEPEVVGPG